MAIENVGPGGVGNNYGARSTNQPTLINRAGLKNPIYDGFDSVDTPTIHQTSSGVLSKSGGGYVAGVPLILKAFTGRSQLTGGTAATKVALMEVPIPDGWLSSLAVRMDIELTANWTNSANTKEIGVALGTGSAYGGAVGSSVDLRTLSFTTTTMYSDKIVVQRNGETPTKLYVVIPNNTRYFGVNPAAAGSTAGVFANAAINPDATGQSLWIWGRIANNTEQISLEHLFVQLQRGIS